ncbi:MAG: RNA methyltransferase [Clostridium sp.]|nr:RNA methyltransferase [Clostridium sp.]
MLTNNERKTFASLATSKGRKATGWFMAQGEKCVRDTLGHFQLIRLLHSADWQCPQEYAQAAQETKPCDLKAISTLNTTPSAIAIYEIPQWDEGLKLRHGELALALDCVQDPGNLGTILRVADWMGVERIFASQDTADIWNPKVVQATMGAISRVKAIYCDLGQMLEANQDEPIYGTFLDGEDIYQSPLQSHGIIIMGNEGNGIRPEIAQRVNRRITIPSYPKGRVTSESLNVAIATAITLAEFRRHG